MTPKLMLFTFLIGVLVGLRSLTPVAATAWATHLGWLKLHSPLSWLGATIGVVICTLLAIGELVADKLPNTPSRTAPPGLIARVLMGALVGACLAASAAQSSVWGAVHGILGALVGTFGGYQVRTRLVKALGTPDFVIAGLEDLLTIAGSFWIVSRF